MAGDSAYFVNLEADSAYIRTLKVDKLVGGLNLENSGENEILFADSNKNIKSDPDFVWTDYVSPTYGSFKGLSVGDVKVYDSGYYHFNVNPDNGLVRAPKVRFGDERRLIPTSPVSVADPDSSNFDFVGLEVDSGKVTSTAKINTFQFDIATEVATARLENIVSDSNTVVKITDINDVPVIELRKDGSINFTGDLYRDGQKFKGGGVFVLDQDNGDAYYKVDPELVQPSLQNPFGIGGRVGVNTEDPKYDLETRGDFMVGGKFSPSDVKFAITKVPGYTQYADDSDISRFAFISSRAAIRGGFYDSTSWNDINNFGEYSTAFGRNVAAKGSYSFALGRNTEASGQFGISIGDSSSTGNANNIGAVTIGRENFINATNISDYTYALGYRNTVAGSRTISFGSNQDVFANNAISIGTNNEIVGPLNSLTASQNSGIFGHSNRLVGAGSFIVGTQASIFGVASFSVGTDNIVGDSTSGANNSFAFGTSNIVLGSNAGAIGTGNRLDSSADYSIGIGLDGTVKDNVVDERLLSIQGGNVSIGAESDHFAGNYDGNLFVAGTIMYAGDLVRFDPGTGNPISTGIFIDDGVYVTYNLLDINSIPKRIGINKGDAYQSLDLSGSFVVEGELGTKPDSGWFNPFNQTKNSFLSYLPAGGILRAGANQSFNDSDIGYHSIALGNTNIAAGTGSVAIGSNNEVYKTGAGAYGDNNDIYGRYSYSLGQFNALLGTSAFNNYVIGYLNKLDSSNADGHTGNANARSYNFIFGANNTFSGYTKGTNNVVIGRGNILDKKSGIDITSPIIDRNVIIGNNNYIQYDSNAGSHIKNNILIGNNIKTPDGEYKVIIKNAASESYNDSSMDNTKVSIGKDVAEYALDVRGSIRIDSGATLYIGSKTIDEYFGRTVARTEVNFDSVGEPQEINSVTANGDGLFITLVDSQNLNDGDTIIISNDSSVVYVVDAITSTSLVLYKDSINGQPYTDADFIPDGTLLLPTINDFILQVFNPSETQIQPNFVVEGDLLVKANGLDFTVDSSGVYADGMTYDSYLIDRGILANYFDSNYVQARVTANEFWQRSQTGDLLYYRPGSGIKPVGIGLGPADITSAELNKYQLNVGVISEDGVINIKDPNKLIDPSKGYSPITLNGEAWPSLEFLGSFQDIDSWVTDKVKFDSNTLRKFIDSTYITSIIDSAYILERANDSSNWQRDSNTLFFGTYPNVRDVRVGIGTDDPDQGIKFQVAGNVKIDSDLNIQGDALIRRKLTISGTDILPDGKFEFTFNDTLYDFNVTQTRGLFNIDSILTVNTDSDIGFTFSNPINTKYFQAYKIDSLGDSVNLVLGTDYYFGNIFTVQVYETALESADLELVLNERELAAPLLIQGTDDNGDSLSYNTPLSYIEILDSLGVVKTRLTTDSNGLYLSNITSDQFIIDDTILQLNDQIVVNSRITKKTGELLVDGLTNLYDSVVTHSTLYANDVIISGSLTIEDNSIVTFNSDVYYDSNAKFYYGPSFKDSANGPTRRLDFDGNIARVVDSAYIGQRLATPWQYTNIDSHVYYNTGGAVIIGSPSDLLPGDNETKFLSIRGNAVFTQRDWDSNSGNVTLDVVPEYGAGARMMFIPQRGAFRAGAVDNISVTWDDLEVGLASVGIGYNAAAHAKSVSIGYETIAGTTNNDIALSIGYGVYNPSKEAVAVGQNITHSTIRTGSVSIGKNITNTTESEALAIGLDATAAGGVAVGRDVSSGRGASVVVGDDVKVSDNSIGLGRAITAGRSSFVLGASSSADTSALAIGVNNSAGRSSSAIGRNARTGTGGNVVGVSSYSAYGSAVGVNNTASRGHAVGYGNNANAIGAIAIGVNNRSGTGSYTFGTSNTADYYSMSFGHGNTGSAYIFNIGKYNQSNTWSTVAIGVGNSNNTRSALLIGRDNKSNSGYYGRMIAVGDINSSNSASIIYGVNNTSNYKTYIWGNNNSGSNDGFGYIYGSNNRITDGGFVFGYSNTTDDGGFAYGSTNTITGGGSAFGSSNTVVNGGYAFGYNNNVDGSTNKFPFAFGNNNTVTVDGIAVGVDNTASTQGIALGYGNNANGIKSIAIGSNAIVTGTSSIAISLDDTNTDTVSDNNTLAIVNGRVAIGTNAVGVDNPSVASIFDVAGRMDVVGTNGDYYRQGVRLFDYIRDEVVDRAYIRFNADSNYIKSAANFDWIHDNISPFFFFGHDNATNDVYYIGGGNVGIHTNDPRYDLDVNGDINLEGALYMNGNLLIPDLDSLGNLNVTYVTEEYYIGPESAERFFDSQYIQDRQAYFDYNLIIDSDYVSSRVDPDLVLDSGEVDAMIQTYMEDVVFKYDVLGRTEYNPTSAQAPLGPRMGIGAPADFTNTLRIAGKVTIGDNTGLTGSLDVWNGNINIRNGNLLIDGAALTSPWTEGTYVTYNPPVPKNIGVRKNTPSYEFDVNGRINADEGLFVNGQNVIDDILDSNYIQSRQLLIDSGLTLGLIDSEYVKGFIDDSYIRSIIDNDYVEGIINDSYVKGIIDSAYVQSIADQDWIRFNADSDYIKTAADETWIRFNADSDYIKTAADETWIRFNADSDYIKSAASQDWIRLNADSDYIKTAANQDWIRLNADSDYIKSAANRDWIRFNADSDYINSATGIGIRNIDFGSYNIRYNNGFANIGSLPNPSTYQGMFAMERTNNKPYVAINGSWKRLALNNEDETFNNLIVANIEPKTANTYDIGTAEKPFRDLYLSGNSLYLGASKVTASGTTIAIDDVDLISETSLSSYIDSSYVNDRLSATAVRQFITGGTGVTITDGEIAIGQDVSTTANVQFNRVETTDGLVIGGDLQVNGTLTTINAQSLNITDNMAYMNAGESEGSPLAFIDIGFAANINDRGSYEHVGFFRDATDGIWKIFEGYAPEPDASLQINTGDSTFSLATLQVASIIADNLDVSSLTRSGNATPGTYGSASSIPVLKIDSSGFVDSIGVVTVAGVTDVTFDDGTRTLTVLTADGDSFSTIIGGVDSDVIINLIDSAYVNARVSGLDSNAIISFVDSAYINARVVIPEVSVDSAVVYNLIDSAYINARVSGLDSDAITSFIDSAYIYSRVSGLTGTTVSLLANQLQYQSYYFVADSDQTVFVGQDNNGSTLGYELGTVQVYVNGFNLLNGTDYTATDGTSIILTEGVTAGTDIVISSLRITGEVTFGLKSYVYALDSGDTQIFGTDDNGETLLYTPGSITVHYNGILIENGTDYTATNGWSINLTSAASQGDEVTIVAATTTNSLLDSSEEYIFRTTGLVTSGTITTVDETAHNNKFKSIEYTIHMDDSDNNQSQITKVLLTYNKSNVFMTEYGTVNSYSNDSDMGTLTADENNGAIRLRFTKATGTGNVRVNPVKIVVN